MSRFLIFWNENTDNHIYVDLFRLITFSIYFRCATVLDEKTNLNELFTLFTKR